MPKNNKANRYYYKNRDTILEKKRIARNEKLVIYKKYSLTNEVFLRYYNTNRIKRIQWTLCR